MSERAVLNGCSTDLDDTGLHTCASCNRVSFHTPARKVGTNHHSTAVEGGRGGGGEKGTGRRRGKRKGGPKQTEDSVRKKNLDNFFFLSSFVL